MVLLYFVLVLAASDEILAQLTPTVPPLVQELVANFTALAPEFSDVTFPDINYNIPILDPIFPGTYDFIIVGSGTAGNVLANRLTENPAWTVLLLEAGVQGDFITDIPVLTTVQQFYFHDWNYVLEKQENMSAGLKDETIAIHQGKGLGGTSLINDMLHVRGNKADYDRWASLGNDGWSYDDVLPYFKKSEDCSVEIVNDTSYRGYGGYLSVQDVPYRTPSVDAYVEAAESLGYPYVDYNGAEQLGVSYMQATTRRGLRCSSEKAFLRPVQSRPNLRISPSSYVTKVLIDSNNTAYGVEFFESNGIIKYTAKASKEVILSAGAIGSPKLLMLSGIGPQDDLTKFGIPVKKNLPVGQIMRDHLTFVGLAFTVNETIDYTLAQWVSPVGFVDLYTSSHSPLASLTGVEGLAYMRTNISTDLPSGVPDAELLYIAAQLNIDYGILIKPWFRISDDVFNVFFKPLEGQNVIGVFPTQMHPKSYGHIELSSAHPNDYPKLYGNYFTDSDGSDMKVFIASIREVQRIFSTPTFQKYDAQQVTTPLPSCSDIEYDSDAYWECALRALATSFWHLISTCKMGNSTDPEAVVDSRLRVYGINSLRVIDSSIIPETVSAHTNVPTYMVAEKGADLVKADWA